MLILTRRQRESIRIGEHIVITVLGIDGSKVRLGIAAPRHVAVDREEVYLEKRGRPGANGRTSYAHLSFDAATLEAAGSREI